VKYAPAFLLVVFLLGAPLAAQEVEVTLTDGTRVVGTWLGTRNGKYHLTVHGEPKAYSEQRVREIRLIAEPIPVGKERPRPGTERSAAYQGYAEMAAIEQAARVGDFDTAFRLLNRLTETLAKMESERSLLYDMVHSQYIINLINERDVAGLAKRVSELDTLPRSNQKSILEFMIMKLEQLVREEPTARFTAELAASIGSALTPETPIDPERRIQMIALLTRVAEKEYTESRFNTATRIYEGLLRMEPGRAEDLRERITETRRFHADQMRGAGKFADAARILREYLEIFPDNAEIANLLEDVEYEKLQKDVAASFRARAEVLLKEYLESPRPEAYRMWAETQLETLAETRPHRVRFDPRIEEYFPVEPGHWMRYARGDGKFSETIFTDSIRAEEDMLHVYYTLEEKYKEWTTRKVYQVQIEHDRVSRRMGDKHEVLLQLPFAPGTSWDWATKDQTFKRTITATDATVIVPAGTFHNCLAVQFDSISHTEAGETRITSTSYYAPGEGLVKIEFHQAEYQRYGLRLTARGAGEGGK
jgi:tetratricopeptide (TPR) repeat protein